MNIALIFAGGVGTRMNSKSVPKQFLEMHGKPIIVHTLDVFQRCDLIDKICISCIPSHIKYMQNLCDKFGLNKVEWIVEGGETGQLSIYNGLEKIFENSSESDIVLIHDGVRPIIDEDLIERNISSVKKRGSAISCSKSIETPVIVDENEKLVDITERTVARIAKAPQSFYLNQIFQAHKKALSEDKRDFIDSASMMRYYGNTVYYVECDWDNIKITSPSDFYIFRAILEAKENFQILGL